MKTAAPPQTATIKATWYEWNYLREDKAKGPFWTEDGSALLTAKVCPRSYVVHYGQGNLRKVLPRFYQRGILMKGTPRKEWRMKFGSMSRMSYTKIVFELVTP